MRSCRAKHNVFVLWEPKGAFCVSTMKPQNGAGHGGWGTVSTLAQQQQGVTEGKAKSQAENRSPNSISSSSTPLFSGCPFPIALLSVQSHGARFLGGGVCLGASVEGGKQRQESGKHRD